MKNIIIGGFTGFAIVLIAVVFSNHIQPPQTIHQKIEDHLDYVELGRILERSALNQHFSECQKDSLLNFSFERVNFIYDSLLAKNIEDSKK